MTKRTLPFDESLSEEPTSRVFLILYPVAIFLLPLYLGSVYLWSFSLSVLVLCLAFLVYQINSFRTGQSISVRTDIHLWIGLYLLFYFFSSIQTQIPYSTIVDTFKLLAAIGVFLMTLYYCADRKEIKRLCMALSSLGGALSLMGLLQYLGGLPRHWWHIKYFLSSVYVNHNHFAGLLEMILPVSLGFVLAEENSAKKTLLIFLSILMGTAFIFTLSRGGYFSLTVALTLMVGLLLKRGMIRKSWWIFAIFTSLVVCAILMFGLQPVEERIKTLRGIDSLENRFDRIFVWKAALAMISKHLWFGTGPGTFGYVFLKFRPIGFTFFRPVYTHNDYLNLLSDCGILAFVAVVGLFVVLFWKGMKIISKDESRLRIGVGSGCLAALTALSIHSFTDFNFHIPANWMMMGVVAGLLLSLEGRKSYYSGITGKVVAVFTSALFAIVFLGCVYFGVSDFFLWKAKRAIKQQDLSSAASFLDGSIGINRLNPEAYFRRGLLESKNQTTQAIRDFERAIRLNSHEPYYDYHKLKQDFSLGRQFRSLSRCEDILVKDPYDPRLQYILAKTLLQVNHSHDKEIDQAAKRMLKRCIELDQWYAKSVYWTLWRARRNPYELLLFYEDIRIDLTAFVELLKIEQLWRYHRKYYLESLGVDPSLTDRLNQSVMWDEGTKEVYALNEFRSTVANTIVSSDHFYRGEVEKVILVKKEICRLVLWAKGEKAHNSYPYLLVKLDGKVVDSLYIGSMEFKNFYSVFRVEPGIHTINLLLINDYCGGAPQKCRVAWLEKITLQYPRT